jgi:hypothetical protein
VYVERKLTLQPGDLLLAYTDGLVEAPNEAGELLGLDGLLDHLAALGDPYALGDAGELSRRLIDSIEADGHSMQSDDCSLVVLDCTGRSDGVSWRDRLAGFRKLWLDFRAGQEVPGAEVNLRTLGGAFIPALNRVGQTEDDGADMEKEADT